MAFRIIKCPRGWSTIPEVLVTNIESALKQTSELLSHKDKKQLKRKIKQVEDDYSNLEKALFDLRYGPKKIELFPEGVRSDFIAVKKLFPLFRDSLFNHYEIESRKESLTDLANNPSQSFKALAIHFLIEFTNENAAKIFAKAGHFTVNPKSDYNERARSCRFRAESVAISEMAKFVNEIVSTLKGKNGISEHEKKRLRLRCKRAIKTVQAEGNLPDLSLIGRWLARNTKSSPKRKKMPQGGKSRLRKKSP